MKYCDSLLFNLQFVYKYEFTTKNIAQTVIYFKTSMIIYN